MFINMADYTDFLQALCTAFVFGVSLFSIKNLKNLFISSSSVVDHETWALLTVFLLLPRAWTPPLCRSWALDHEDISELL